MHEGIKFSSEQNTTLLKEDNDIQTLHNLMAQDLIKMTGHAKRWGNITHDQEGNEFTATDQALNGMLELAVINPRI